MITDNCISRITDSGTLNDFLKNSSSLTALGIFLFFDVTGWGLLSLPMLKSTLIKAAKAGAAEILRFFNTNFKISNKEGVNNLVTEADHAAEKAIIEVVGSA